MIEQQPIFNVESKPLFRSAAEYQAFRESYMEEVAPELEKWRLARLRSERESMFRIVD